MVDDVRDITETAESKEALDRARLARERREVEQKKRLNELRAHAAAAQAQREKRDEERRKRQAEQRAREDDRRQQVEDRKRAIWEASVSRREALLQRERERTERVDRVRAARSAPRSAFAFGSSTPRLLEPFDSSGFFWAARRAASATNVMLASTPLVKRASTLQLNSDNPDDQPPQAMWSSVARRRTDLVPTLPAPRAPGRAYSMTRLDKIPAQRPLHSASPSMHHLNRTRKTYDTLGSFASCDTRSGESMPGSRPSSRPGSAMSNTASVTRRPNPARKPRPASVAGTGVNSPTEGVDTLSAATSPSVSRDGTLAGGDVPRRKKPAVRRHRPVSMHVTTKPATTTNPADGKPPIQIKPKQPKDKMCSLGVHDTNMTTSSPASVLSKSLFTEDSPPSSIEKEINLDITLTDDKNQVSAVEVTQKLEALQIENGEEPAPKVTVQEKENLNLDMQMKPDENAEQKAPVESQKPVEVQKPAEKKDDRKEEKKEPSQEKTEEVDMSASMTARRITTEEEAKAALAERRRRAREELEKQAELERQRLQREAEEEAERQRLEEEKQRRDEEEARELAQLQRKMEEEKLRKAIEVQQALEREEADRKVREEADRQARLKEEEEKRKAAEQAERIRKEEAEREEKERLARKQRVEAIMARTRLKKAEEDKKQQDSKNQPGTAAPAPVQPQSDNGNAVPTNDLLGFGASQSAEEKEKISEPAEQPETTPNNGNVTADLLGLSQPNDIENKTQEQTAAPNKQVIDNSNANAETNNGNVSRAEPTGVGHISANFIQTERMSAEHQTKMPENVPKLIEDDFTAHNGHGATHNHPLTLQNAI